MTGLGVVSAVFEPRVRLTLALAMIAGTVVGWPLSQLTWAADEPPFVLGLSWLAIFLTALDMAYTALVALEQERERKWEA